MAQNKLENQFQKKLNQRSIKPSDMAWDRLDAMLSVSEKKKPKQTWLWIAASLLVFISLGSLFLRTDNKNADIPNQEIVFETKTNQAENPPLKIISVENTKKTGIANHTAESKQPILLPKKVVTDNHLDLISIEETAYSEEKTDTIPNKTIEKSQLYISAESLLAQVEKGQIQETRKLQTKTNIDANLLLVNTIKEMDEVHKNNAFKEFQNKFKTIKEAVSDRNKE